MCLRKMQCAPMATQYLGAVSQRLETGTLRADSQVISQRIQEYDRFVKGYLISELGFVSE